MDEAVMAFQAKCPAMHKVIDGYYTLDDDTDWSKISAMKLVMKSAINITKSKTGEAVLKTNRVEQTRLKYKFETVRREKTSADAMVNRDKVVFKAQYGKWLNNNRAMPRPIKIIREKYKRIRNERRSRKRERTSINPVFTTAMKVFTTGKAAPNPFAATEREVGSSTLKRDLMSQVRATNFLRTPTIANIPTPQTPTQRRVLSGVRQVVSRDSVRKRQIAIWREKTFDMDTIRDTLIEEDLKQQSMYCKLKINNYKKEKLKREETSVDRFNRNIAFPMERQKSASTISELYDSRPVTMDSRKPTVLPLLWKQSSKSSITFNELRQKNKQVSFHS